MDKILSIILFGSQASNQIENTNISDCDILVIFKDGTSQKKIKNIEKYFVSLEIKHQFREHTDSFFKKVLDVIQRSTGMFVSHFVTKKRDWENTTFYRIFSVNRLFSTLFAPTKIVLSSVIDNSIILYGLDLRQEVKKKLEIPSTDMIKSIIMNSIISIFSILISPFKKLKSIKYNLEAIKWSLKASNYYLFQDSPSLKTITKRFERLNHQHRRKKSKIGIFFLKFLLLRKFPTTDFKFYFQTPLNILRIHINGILYKLNKYNSKKN
ncbi:MAG: nucleotidyltransferase domain-containing protein [Candidatus Lokiarchaeota archaeon]|nr:nucleotidyltransferase domain-containing protein [Candidatus Lokiarchaeota archaeon]